MAVSAQMVKELREVSGAGFMDCKKALAETDGDMEKAIVFLREKGLADASKKAGRIASEGLVLTYLSDDGKKAAVVEVNSETDFVAKNQEFRNFVAQVAKQAADTNAKDLDGFLADAWAEDQSVTVKDALTQKIATFGENLGIRRFDQYEKQANGALVSYVHGDGKISVLMELVSEKEDEKLLEAGKNICMQIAALNPRFISKDDVSQEFIDQEKEILKQQALNENTGKPENVIEKMVEGRLNKELKEFCLLEQQYVKDGDLTVKKYLEAVGKEIGSSIEIKRFTRFETGEGIEKKQENFAEEVSKAMQN